MCSPAQQRRFTLRKIRVLLKRFSLQQPKWVFPPSFSMFLCGFLSFSYKEYSPPNGHQLIVRECTFAEGPMVVLSPCHSVWMRSLNITALPVVYPYCITKCAGYECLTDHITCQHKEQLFNKTEQGIWLESASTGGEKNIHYGWGFHLSSFMFSIFRVPLNHQAQSTSTWLIIGSNSHTALPEGLSCFSGCQCHSSAPTWFSWTAPCWSFQIPFTYIQHNIVVFLFCLFHLWLLSLLKV